MSFVESSFFPVPPDVMLAPMCLAQPQRAWHPALLTRLTSVAGGLLGYAIGYFAIDALLPWLQESRYWPAYQKAVEWFGQRGFWAVFIAGFSPIPYKVFTIAAGALSMALLPFTLASLIGRGACFFLVAGLMAWGGARMEAALHRYIDRLGWAMLALLALGLLVRRKKAAVEGGACKTRHPVQTGSEFDALTGRRLVRFIQIGLIVGGLVLPLTAATLVVLLIRQRAMMRVTP